MRPGPVRRDKEAIMGALSADLTAPAVRALLGGRGDGWSMGTGPARDGWKFTERAYEVRYSTTVRWPGRRQAQHGADMILTVIRALQWLGQSAGDLRPGRRGRHSQEKPPRVHDQASNGPRGMFPVRAKR